MIDYERLKPREAPDSAGAIPPPDVRLESPQEPAAPPNYVFNIQTPPAPQPEPRPPEPAPPSGGLTAEDRDRIQNDIDGLRKLIESKQAEQKDSETSDLQQRMDMLIGVLTAQQSEQNGLALDRRRAARKHNTAAGAFIAVVGLLVFSQTDAGQEQLKKAGCALDMDRYCDDLEGADGSDEPGNVGNPDADQPQGQDSSLPVITAPPIPGDSTANTTPPYVYIPSPGSPSSGGECGDSSECAPGLPPSPEDLNDMPIYISRQGQEGFVVTPNVSETEGLVSSNEEGKYLLEEVEENVFTPSLHEEDRVKITWETLSQDPSGQAYEIQFRQKTGEEKYASDQTLGEYLGSDEVTNRELLQFLFHEKIVPNYVDNLYVEIKGYEGGLLRTVESGVGNG